MPVGIIDADEMVLIMTDMHLVEGAKIGRKIMGDTVLIDEYYHKVFDKYHTDKETFEKSFRHYSSDPEGMDAIYVKVIENLNQMQKNAPMWEESQKIKEGVLERADSISASMKTDSTKTDSLTGAQTVTDTIEGN